MQTDADNYSKCEPSGEETPAKIHPESTGRQEDPEASVTAPPPDHSASSVAGLQPAPLTALPANFRHLGLRSTGTLYGDLVLFKEYTGIPFAMMYSAVAREIGEPEDRIAPFVRNVVNERSPRDIGDLISGFRGELYAPQAAVLRRMREIETAPPIYVRCGDPYAWNAGLLRERCSFGKTFLLAALACVGVPEARGAPAIRPPRRAGWPGIQEARYVPATVVVCSGRVAAEFCATVARVTDLRCVRVHSAASLRKVAEEPLPALLKGGEEDPVGVGQARTIYVVKDGESTWEGRKVPTLAYFSLAARTAAQIGRPAGSPVAIPAFDRVIFDDFDLLKLPAEVDVPAARFYWRTSATAETPPKSERAPVAVCEKLNSVAFSVKILSEISCSADFSALEFGVPRPQFWLARAPPVEVAAALALAGAGTGTGGGVEFEPAEAPEVEKVVFSGGRLIPPPPGQPPKILLCDFPAFDRAEKREIRDEEVRELAARGVAALALTSANAARFARDPEIAVGVSCLLHGVNMGYLTHVVVNTDEFTPAEVAQIVGRGQRLGRASSLQVYFAQSFSPERLVSQLRAGSAEVRFSEREIP